MKISCIHSCFTLFCENKNLLIFLIEGIVLFIQCCVQNKTVTHKYNSVKTKQIKELLNTFLGYSS